MFTKAPRNTKGGVSADLVEIDALIAAAEQDPNAAEAIAAGRKNVADAFYADRATSLTYYRLRKGWSQKQLAAKAKSNQAHVARIEIGTVDPSQSAARKISQALGISLAMFNRALTLTRK